MMDDSIRFPLGSFRPVPHPTPEERMAWIRQIPGLAAALSRRLQPLDHGVLQVPYRAGGWSIRQIVHHMADNDMNAFLRFKIALTEEGLKAASYREDLFADLADYRDVPAGVSLALLELLHTRFAALLYGLRPDDFKKTLETHALGVITLDTALQRFVWHNLHHTAQIETFIKRLKIT